MPSTGKPFKRIRDLFLLLSALFFIVLQIPAEARERVPFFVSDYFIRNDLDSWDLSAESLSSKMSARISSKKKSGLLLTITDRELERILQPREQNPLVPIKVSVMLDGGPAKIVSSVELPHEHNRGVRKEHAVKNIMQVCTQRSLQKHEVMQAVQFIEEDFSPWISQGHYFLPKETTGLMGDVEYDPATGLYFLHFDVIIGEGCNKIVTLSLLYGIEAPEMVVTATPRIGNEIEGEVAILKMVQHIDRVLHLIADPSSFQHRMITELYEGGSLAEAIQDPHFSMRKKALMAKGLLETIKEVHRSGFVHLDIHSRNLLLDKTDRLVLIDWGTAKVLDKTNIFYKQSDLFSAGMTFYSLIYPSVPLGPFHQKLKIFKEFGKNEGAYQAADGLLLGELSPELTERKNALDKAFALGIISFDEMFERIVLHMLHPLKEESRDASYWYLELDHLLSTP